MRNPEPRWSLAAAAALLAAGLAAPPAARAQAPGVTEPPGAAPAPARTPDVHFVPTPNEVVARMMDLAAVGPGDVVYDLGCGDGRIVVAAAKRGARKVVGVDIDPERVAEARAAVRAARVGDRATIVEGDLFELDLSDATVVTLYLLPELNLRLRPTLERLRPGTRVVSHAFDMGDWVPERTAEVAGKSVFLWRVRPRGEGGTAAGAPAR
jgi:SAM-dependent methyltransferase